MATEGAVISVPVETSATEIPIPDVSNANLIGRDGDLFGQEDEGEQEQEAPTAEQVAQPEVVQPEKEYINPHGRARVAEREARDMRIKMDRLLQALQAKEEETEAPEQVEEVDPELDPIGSLRAQIVQLQNQITQREQREQTEQQQRMAANALAQADRVIQASMQQNPAVYQGAIMHLARFIENNVENQMPNYTHEERMQIAAQQIAQKKLEWVATGKNPAQEMFNMAVTLGYNPSTAQPAQPEQPETPAPAKAKADARQKLQANRQRQAQTASLGGTVGSAPNNLNAAALKAMDMDKFNFTINQAIKSGQLAPKRTIGKTPSLRDLLPGKGVRV